MSISANSSDRVCENGIQPVELLPATNDAHGGVIVDMKDAMEAQHFLTLLRASISQWRREVGLPQWMDFFINSSKRCTNKNACARKKLLHYILKGYSTISIKDGTDSSSRRLKHDVLVGNYARNLHSKHGKLWNTKARTMGLEALSRPGYSTCYSNDSGRNISSETPNSLIERGSKEERRKLLERIRGIENVNAEFQDMLDASEFASAIKHPFRNILERRNRPQLVMEIFMPTFQILTCINSILFYAPVLFQIMGFGGNAALYSSALTGAVLVSSTLISTAIVDKLSRRVLLISDGIIMIICQGKKGVWIKLPIELVNLVETTVKEGFRYHHAEPHYLMLVYWIPETTDTLPANASHRVAVGAIVVNDKKEMLVVQEKCGRFQGKGVWKIPTGVVDEGEDIFKAAVREVKEETGIDAEFLEVLAFRQLHNTFFEKSDLFFVCMLHPLTFDIEKQELEIEAAKWMPLEEYAAQPVTQKHALFKYILELGSLKLDRDYAGFSPLQITSVFDDELSFLYLNRQQMQCLSSPDQSS